MRQQLQHAMMSAVPSFFADLWLAHVVMPGSKLNRLARVNIPACAQPSVRSALPFALSA